MYLEKCVQPKFYIQFLERLLESSKPEFQPVLTVELWCLLGHEMRKVGEKEKYNDYMEKAKELYLKKKTEFETKPLSEVVYLHSFARHLSEKKTPEEPKKIYETALEICKEKIPGHPERAATLLFAGRYAKRSQKHHEAKEKFKEAFALFRDLLGDHFMTAQCLKDYADFLLFRGKTDQLLDKSLSYYQKALRMIEKLGMDGHKESILTLKNYAVCHKSKGNLEEAERLLQKAGRVAERELEEDHKWKVMVKTELALLYHDLASKETEPSMREGMLGEMEASMKEGLDMSYRLDSSGTIDDLGNRHLIRKVLKHYPERFPEGQYPRH